MDNLNADFIISNENPIEAEYELTQGDNFDCSFEVYASGTVWGSIVGNIEDQPDLINALNSKADNSTVEQLSDTVTANTYDIGLIQDTIEGFGDIVTYNAASFATSIQGALADSAIQPNDNITLLNNNAGYIDSSALAPYATTEALNAGLSTKQNTISDLSTIRSNATNGQTAYTTIQTYGDIVTHNVSEFATSIQGGLADTALQPNDNISELNNNVGYITSADLPTVNNSTITFQKNNVTVGDVNLNQPNNETINFIVPTKASDINAVPTTRTINSQALSADITLSASDVGALSSSTTINDLTTSAQQNALNSGATSTNIGQIATNTSDITTINSKIPTAASNSNQLADKSFVNSSIASNTANFIGTFNSVADLEAYSGTLTNNDYAFVETTDTAGNTLYDRYKWNGTEWLFEYELNNSSFTATQWAAINSGITSSDITTINSALQPNDNVSSLINDAGYLTSASLPAVNNGILTIQQNGSNVQTFGANSSTNVTANIVVPTDTNDLTNGAGYITGINSNDVVTALGYTPYNSTNPNGYQANVIETISVNGAAQTVTNKTVNIAVPTNNNQLTNGAGYITGISSTMITTALGYTPYNSTNPDGYITGIGSSDVTTALGYTPYNDTNPDGFISGITSSDVTTALGYTPYDSSNPNGYTSNVGTVTSVNNVAPVSGNVTLSIPTVNNATLTIQKNSTTVSTFTANASSNVTCDIAVPTDTNDLTNGAGFITNSDLSDYQLIAPSITSLSTSGSITLTDNTYYKINATGNITFTLPTVTDTTVLHRIEIELTMSTVRTIDLGLGTTPKYFNATAPDLSTAGTYNLLYQYSPSESAWYCGGAIIGVAS